MTIIIVSVLLFCVLVYMDVHEVGPVDRHCPVCNNFIAPGRSIYFSGMCSSECMNNKEN